ncbi:MAG: 16S rRNA (guanine(527)-N(7))-methyltransferase RsmG [Desulfobacteraceae bacterium]|jgi:16S rRNA (guanine527-N7)-methyltransferase
MEIGSPGWLDIIMQGAAQMGLTVTADQARQFALHGRYLLEWNRRINLTAITEPEDVAAKHFLDAIAPLAHLPGRGCLLDIGTGGGFPGLPLKVMMPELSMTLIDGVRKKVNFVKYVIRQLELENIQALQARAEALGRDKSFMGGFQIIVCRALADLDKLLDLAVPLLAPGGRIIAYQGPQGNGPSTAEAHSACLTRGERRFNATAYHYRLPFLGDSRCVTILESP